MVGRIVAINTSEKTGSKKSNIGKADFKIDLGIEGDAHSGPGHRQISILSLSSIDKMRKLGIELNYGDFAENITVDNLEVNLLPVGTKLKCGDVILEVTQIGKECHNKGCAIKKQAGFCVMPKEGIFAIVLQEGTIEVDQDIEVIQ